MTTDIAETTHEDVPNYDEHWPEGRMVHYEGADPVGFAAEMLAEFGFDVRVIPDGWTCWCGGGVERPDGSLISEAHPWGWDIETCRMFGGRPFVIPAGLMGTIWGSGRWSLGS